jgi:hypothetical protein
MNKHTREGLHILARIIARDFTKNQSLDGDINNECANDKHLQDERPLSVSVS